MKDTIGRDLNETHFIQFVGLETVVHSADADGDGEYADDLIEIDVRRFQFVPRRE